MRKADENKVLRGLEAGVIERVLIRCTAVSAILGGGDFEARVKLR